MGVGVGPTAANATMSAATLRQSLIEDLHPALVGNGTLWLHGSSGLGKTTLALLLVRRQNAAWTFADLRDREPRALRLVLARLSTTFGASGARGLILDDLPADADNATILAIKRVARAVANADGCRPICVFSVRLMPQCRLNESAMRPQKYRAHFELSCNHERLNSYCDRPRFVKEWRERRWKSITSTRPSCSSTRATRAL